MELRKNPQISRPHQEQLFNRSVLKQRKYQEITALLGPTDLLDCLDIGSDNGVISYLLRQRGGTWQSADLDKQSVRAIQELVKLIKSTGTCDRAIRLSRSTVY